MYRRLSNFLEFHVKLVTLGIPTNKYNCLSPFVLKFDYFTKTDEIAGRLEKVRYCQIRPRPLTQNLKCGSLKFPSPAYLLVTSTS